jgi:hypothetical protein
MAKGIQCQLPISNDRNKQGMPTALCRDVLMAEKNDTNDLDADDQPLETTQ